MAIIKDKTSLVSIFRSNFEEGSEGKGKPGKTETGKKDLPQSKTSVFNGYLRKEGGSFFLDTLGGVRVALSFKDGASGPEPCINKLTSVTGTQMGDKIIGAEVSPQNSSNSSRRQSTVQDPALVELAAAVKEFISKYRPVILTARPGYKFVDGVITDTPAIVAVVNRKINPASLDNKQKLPSAFRGFEVDVVSASPRDYLLFKYSKENK